MSWRVVIISKIAKLDLKLGSLVIRGEDVNRIHLSEIGTLIIENTAVSLTAALLCELINKKIKVIFCNEKRNPHAELMAYYGSHDTSAKIKTQIAWADVIKQSIWAEIIRNKIMQQAYVLQLQSKQEAKLLQQYAIDVKSNDVSNREGHAAKVYFNALFGSKFSRNLSCNTNAALNYGYAILLSAFNREVVSNGYLTQIGIHHDNIFNTFNLSSDLMEPFRPIVDRLVAISEFSLFEKNEKHMMANVLNVPVVIDNQTHFLSNAIKKYCKSVFDALNHSNLELIRFYTINYEL